MHTDTKDWVWTVAVVVAVAVLFVLYIVAIHHLLAPVVPVHHAVIHSGIGNALCTPSTVCSQEL